MLCLTHWIQRRWPPTGTVPWVWAIPTAHTQVEAGPDTRPNPPPRPQQSLTFLKATGPPGCTQDKQRSCRDLS